MAIIRAMIEHSPQMECFLEIREDDPMEADYIEVHEAASRPTQDPAFQQTSPMGPTPLPRAQVAAQALRPRPQPGPSTQVPSWCKCGRCREMPTLLEQRCCRRTRGPCVTHTAAAEFNVAVFNETMLVVCIRDRNEVFILNDDPAAHDCLRNMAYRRYILWKYGHLGASNRRVIPSCIVWGIRSRYPSTDNTYVGYIPARLH